MIRPDLFHFFRALRENNHRAWFQQHKPEYERAVRDPLTAFICAIGERLPGFAPHFVADPRPVGGSLFRIHRDVRFSRDKTPYKLAAGVQFRHELARDAHAPGYYLHLQPDACFVGVGIWRPPSDALNAIRQALVQRPADWARVVDDPGFAAVFTLGGESLKRAPRGFDPKHPLIEEVKRKDFVASCPLTEDQVCEVDFVDHFVSLCDAGEPLMRFLCHACNVPF